MFSGPGSGTDLKLDEGGEVIFQLEVAIFTTTPVNQIQAKTGKLHGECGKISICEFT
jgi:hypothetical protein